MPIGGTRSRRQLHLIGAIGVVVVVAGSAGIAAGFSGRGPSTTHGQSGRHALAAASSAGAARASAPATAGAIACPMIPAPGTSPGTPESVPDSGVGSAIHIFTRTTSDGVTIRAYRLSTTGVCGCGSDESVEVELSDVTAVGQGDVFEGPGAAATGNAGTEPMAIVSNAFGVAEGAPVWWTAVTVGPDVATVEMTFPDGSTDQMAPVDGVAVLAHQIGASVATSGQGPYEVRGTLQLVGASGSAITTVTLPASTPVAPTPPVPVIVSPPAMISPPAVTSPPSKVGESVPTTTVATVKSPALVNGTGVVNGTAVTSGSTVACPEVTPTPAPVTLHPPSTGSTSVSGSTGTPPPTGLPMNAGSEGKP
jgi:hypothetical protein